MFDEGGGEGLSVESGVEMAAGGVAGAPTASEVSVAAGGRDGSGATVGGTGELHADATIMTAPTTSKRLFFILSISPIQAYLPNVKHSRSRATPSADDTSRRIGPCDHL